MLRSKMGGDPGIFIPIATAEQATMFCNLREALGCETAEEVGIKAITILAEIVLQQKLQGRKIFFETWAGMPESFNAQWLEEWYPLKKR